jgi:hypothetical protein
MRQNIMNFFSFILIVAVIGYNKPQAVLSRGIDEAMGDTTSFTPNQQQGWAISSSYLNQDTPDSIEFELLVRHDNNIAWDQEQIIGAITNSIFKPVNNQIITYQLLSNNLWNVKIEPSGQCYLKLIQGSAPPDNPAIFPIRIRYKNN